MEYALERLDHLIQIVLRFSLIGEGDTGTINEWTELSRRENIRAFLLHKSLSIRKEKEFWLLIQHYQAAIIQLMELVSKKCKRAPQRPINTAAGTIGRFKEVLLQIEQRYARYFNLDDKVPVAYVLVTQADLRKKVKRFRTSLSAAIKDEALLRVIFEPLDLLLKPEGNIVYRQIMYIKELVAELEQFEREY